MGGGGAGASFAGGGGGGYTGASGGNAGGATSYNIGSNQVNTSGWNGASIPNNGSVTVQIIPCDGDTELPVLTCPVPITVFSAPGTCTSAAVTYGLSATDNCFIAEIVQINGLPSGATFPAGVTNNTFRAKDGANNTVSCSFVVTVVDDSEPTAICQDISVQLNATGTATITPDDVDSGSFDNCQIESLTLDKSTFNYPILPGTGKTTVTAGSGHNYSVTITLRPTVVNAPTSCPWGYTYTVDIEYEVSFTGNAPASGLYILQGNLACDPATSFFKLLKNKGFVNKGVYTAGTTKTSNAWNGESNCQTISPRTLGCDLIALQIKGPGIPYQVINIPISYQSTETVVLTVTDQSGNTASCSSQVTILPAGSQALPGPQTASTSLRPPTGHSGSESIHASAVQVYPNPVANRLQVTIAGASGGRTRFEIYDLSGRVMHSESRVLDSGYNEIELAVQALPTGLYLLRVRDSEDQQWTLKVSKL